jgi:hypothetical protein
MPSKAAKTGDKARSAATGGPIENMTSFVVEMDDTVDGLRDGSGVLSAMEVDRHER